MVRIQDAAACVLRNCPTLATMKMHKLVFYSQALSLVERGVPLFDDDFQAWRNGPAAPSLFAMHRRMFLIHDGELDGDADALDADEKNIVKRVCDALCEQTGNQLSLRTHREDPWKDARGDIPDVQRSNALISKQSMMKYYSEHPVL